MSHLPIFVNTSQNAILLIGAGAIALAKLRLISDYSNNITVVSKEYSPLFVEYSKNLKIKLIKDSFKEEHLDGHDIIIAATNDKKANQEISDLSKKRNLLINVVDDSALCNFIFGAVVKRGKLNIAISSNGYAPVLARYVKQKIEFILPNNFAKLAEFFAKYRSLFKEKFKDIQARRLFMQDVIEGAIAEEIMSGNEKKSEKMLYEALDKKANKAQAAVYFIGAGSGDPELMSLKAIRLISKADIILHDRLVSPEIFNFARKDAEKINVGKKKDFHRYKQSEINELLRKYAKENHIVVRLKGGDPAIFARLDEEIDAIRDLNVPYQIVPAVTAASAAAASLGIPLTKRNVIRGTRFLTLYKNDLLRPEYWQELAKSEDSLVFYMSSHNIDKICENLILHGKDPQSSILLIEQATTPFQREYAASLADFNKKYGDIKFKSPSLIIIGNILQGYENYVWKERNENNIEYFEQLTPREL